MLNFLLTLFFVLIPLPGLCLEDASLTKELVQNRENRAKAIEAIPTNDALKMAENLEALSKDPLAAGSILDEKVQKAMTELYASGAMEKIPPEEIKANLMANVKGSKLEWLLKRFPVFIDIMVDLVKSKEAIPGLMRMMGRKDDLKFYFKIWLSIFILSFIFKRFWLRQRIEDFSWIYRTMVNLSLSIFVTVTTIFIFYAIFRSDVYSFFSILGKHLI